MSLTSVLITPCVAVHSCDTAGILGLRLGWGGEEDGPLMIIR